MNREDILNMVIAGGRQPTPAPGLLGVSQRPPADDRWFGGARDALSNLYQQGQHYYDRAVPPGTDLYLPGLAAGLLSPNNPLMDRQHVKYAPDLNKSQGSLGLLDGGMFPAARRSMGAAGQNIAAFVQDEVLPKAGDPYAEFLWKLSYMPGFLSQAKRVGAARPWATNLTDVERGITPPLGWSDVDIEGLLGRFHIPSVSSLPIAPTITPARGKWKGQKTRHPYPGIYKPVPQQIEEAAALAANHPENPLLEGLLGVTRQDLDDMMRARVQDPMKDVPIHPTTKRGARHVKRITNPKNTDRLIQTLEMAGADPRLAGFYGWYESQPLKDLYRKLWGKERGDIEFDKFAQRGSAMSPASPVALENRRASLAGLLEEQGRFDEFMGGYLASGEGVQKALPDLFGTAKDAGQYSHMYHTSNHTGALQRMEDTGKFFSRESAMKAPKTPNYYGSKLGDIIRWPTQDSHFVRQVGLPDVRQFSGPAWTGSVQKAEAKPVREWFSDKVAAQAGMQGSPSQALLWNTLGPQTGVETIGKPWLELIVDGAEKEARRKGISPKQALHDFILKQGLL